jgi:protein-tyrosine phosphatase
MGAVGIAAVGALIYAGIMYSSAGGESSQVQKAKTVIKDTVIGIVAFSFMIIILNFVIPGGVFGQQGVTGGGTVAHTPDESGGGGGGGSATSTTFSGVKNFRDASVSSGGKLLKSGLLYRSANLNDATKDDVTKLSALLKGGFILDLRTSTDKAYKKDPTPSGINNVHIQIKGEASAAGYKKTFVNSTKDREKFGDAVTKIANATGPVLIHCKSGKDRTGWTVAMIMYILGDGKYSADELDAIVMKEYMLSKTQGGLKVEEDWLDTGLNAARAKYGSIMAYIKKGMKVSDTTISALKKRLAA